MTFIQTLSGHRFELIHPNPNDIVVEDLSASLSRMCRFGGHCTAFYSVAQHSVFVHDLVDSPELRLPALLHDAHEAYWGFGDLLRPAKRLDDRVREFLENHRVAIDEAVATRFGFDPALFEHETIKHADNVALATERRDVMAPSPWTWEPLPEADVRRILPAPPHIARKSFEIALWTLLP